MSHATVNLSTVQTIDGLLSGVRWGGTVFTYGFPTAASDYGNNYAWLLDHDNNPMTPAITVNETTGFSALNAMQQAAAEAAFLEFRNLTTMSALRVEPANSADIKLAMSTTRDPNNTTAYADYPGDDTQSGDAWFNTTQYNSPRLGTYAYQTFFHEIGHALGLKHGHEGDNGNNTLLPSNRDSLEFSTMTYRSYIGAPTTGGYSVQNGHYPQTYMMLDIAALQYMYGADYTTNSGATTYRFDPANAQMFVNGTGQGVPQNNAGNNTNVLFRTIWDGGGTDTYDFSAYNNTSQLVIDLAPGGWTDVDSDSDFQAANLDTGDPSGKFARGQVFNALLVNGDLRSLIENAIGGAGDDWIKGNQANNHLWGNDGKDTLEGFDGHDILDAGVTGGGSEMYGGNHNDTIWASPDADYIDGGSGFDRVDYSRSSSGIQVDTTAGKVVGGWATGDTLVSIEHIVGSAFDDSLRTGDGFNYVFGGNGSDNIATGSGNDFLYGENGDDVLYGGSGGDLISGGAGFDIAVFGSAVTVNFAANAHKGEAAGDSYYSIEQFNGSDQADTMVAYLSSSTYFSGGDGNDSFYGGNANDWLQGGKGDDLIHGGGGSDFASYADATNRIVAELYINDGTTDGKITAGDWGFDTLVSIENIEGTNFHDIIYGDERANVLRGLGGHDDIKGDAGGSNPPASNDTLQGGAGNDTLDGGGGFDLLEGGTGDDLFYVDSDFDQVREAAGQGYDTVVTTATFTLHATLAEVEVLMTSNAAGTQAINLTGSNFSNRLIGNAGHNKLTGRDGNDFLCTDPGIDTLDGGNGFDTIVFTKVMVADWQAGNVDADIASDTWISWEAIQGSSGNDVIRTNSWGFQVKLMGGDGNDVLATGVTGVVSDTLFGDNGNDDLNGGAGGDFLYGGAGNDTVRGSDGFDKLYGGGGNDRMFGGGGNDQLRGAGGSDTMTGGAGGDRFIFQTLADMGTGAKADYITDFRKSHSDRIDLAGIDANAGLDGNQAFAFLAGKGAAFTAAGQARFRQEGGDTFIDLNTNANLNTIEATVKLEGLFNLSAGDFIL